MFTKFVSVVALFFALGTTLLCVEMASATTTKSDSSCLNGVNQGSACAGVTQMGCTVKDYTDANGNVTSKVAIFRAGSVQYQYKCSDAVPADKGKTCCVKSIVCFKGGSALVFGNPSNAYVCAQAEKHMNEVQPPLYTEGDTCFVGEVVNGKTCS